MSYMSGRFVATVKEEGFSGGSEGKESACNAGDLGLIHGLEDPLEEKMATHSSIFNCKIPWTEEPGGLLSVHGVAKHTHISILSITFLTVTWISAALSPVHVLPTEMSYGHLLGSSRDK